MRRKLVVLSLILFISWLVCATPVLAAVGVDEFKTLGVGDEILVQWHTVTEIDNAGFYVQRANQLAGPFSRVSPYFPALGDEGIGEFYFWFDESVVQNVIYYYRLEAIDKIGVSEFFGPIAGSTNEELLTRTPQSSPTPTRTLTPLPPGGTLTPTASTLPATQTLTTPGVTPSPTATSRPGDPTQAQATGTITLEPGESVTPTVTKTLEPLPTIELIFPATDTPAALEAMQVMEAPVEAMAAAAEEPPQPESSDLPSRTIALIGIVVAIWLCLGLYLVFWVRRLGD